MNCLGSALHLVLRFIQHCWSWSTQRSGYTLLLFVQVVLALFTRVTLLKSFLNRAQLFLLEVRCLSNKVPIQLCPLWLRNSHANLLLVLPSLVPVQLSPRPSRSIPFGDVSEANAREKPRQKQPAHAFFLFFKRRTLRVYVSGQCHYC